MSPDKLGAKQPGQRKASAQKDKAPSPAKKTGRTRSKRKTVTRVKAYWGVFNDLLQQVAVFEYRDRAKAEKSARQLTKTKKGSYFVRIVKRTVD